MQHTAVHLKPERQAILLLIKMSGPRERDIHGLQWIRHQHRKMDRQCSLLLYGKVTLQFRKIRIPGNRPDLKRANPAIPVRVTQMDAALRALNDKKRIWASSEILVVEVIIH